MILKQKNGISFFQFPNLALFADIRHAIFTRNGGHSSGPFLSLNVSSGVGDEEKAVKENRALISREMGEKESVFARQVHGTKVLVFSKQDTSVPQSLGKAVLIGDAMVTDIREKNLVIQVADCQALLMYDPVRRVIANIHSGWRGSIANIIGHTLIAMKKNFGCDPVHIVAGIGPSLGPCCAEFVNYKKEIPETFWKYKNDSDCFDFWAVSRDQLCDAGVSEENIHISGLCTRCRTDLFFSYRAEGITGRFAAVIGLK